MGKTTVNTVYTWTITFESNARDQLSSFNNTLNLLGNTPSMSVNDIRTGAVSDNYQFKIVTSTCGSESVVFDIKDSNDVEYYYLLLAANAKCDGPLSGVTTATAASAPLTPGKVVVETTSGSTIKAAYTQDSAANGDTISTGYAHTVTDIDGVEVSKAVPVSNEV